MSSPQRPHFLTQVLVSGTVFLSGPPLGTYLSKSVAPDSVIADFVGFSMLPFALITGLQLWGLCADLKAIYHWVMRLSKKSRGQSSKSYSEQSGSVPSGSFLLIVYFTAVTTLAGLITTAVSTVEGGLGTILLKYALLGMIYGSVCWSLVCCGYLKFDD